MVMSNTDDLDEQKSLEQEAVQKPILVARPLHRQFSGKLIALFLTITVALALIFTLFYQQNERSRFLIDGELTPLKEKFEQLQALKKATYIVDELLFIDRGKNFVALHTELIEVNEQLLQLDSSNAHLYQQWLNTNKLASDNVFRIQKNHDHNEELKRSSIVQVKSMLVSLAPVINNKAAQLELLFKQLNSDKVNDGLTFNRASAYVSATQQSLHLQELKILLTQVLTEFEQLTIHTSMKEFDSLRFGVLEALAKQNALTADDKTKAIVDIKKQIGIFKDIVLTQQRALAKWQGYIRLAQGYQLDLALQKEQLAQIQIDPNAKNITHTPRLLDILQEQYKINLTQAEFTKIIVLAIGLSLFIFCYLLWRLRAQIKISAQQSVILVQKSIDTENNDDIQANCFETNEIIQQVQSIAKPAHSEQEFQSIIQKCDSYQQLIDEQANHQKQLEFNEQVEYQLNCELQRYKNLEAKALAFIHQQQAKLFNKTSSSKANTEYQLASILPIYEQLKQFYLASDIRSESTALCLVDVNLVDEIHAILMNKQTEQCRFNNQLNFSCDENILAQARFDFRLFQQMMNLLIDFTLQDITDAQLHLDLQLQDKSKGQQLIHFSLTVKSKNIEALPSLVMSLAGSESAISHELALVDMFNIIFTRQYGENIVAQLIDGGFQFSFELPLALTSLSKSNEHQTSKYTSIKVMLLSSNQVLTEVIEKSINSMSGQLEVLSRLDSFEQQFTAKHLSNKKLDILIVTSDFAQTNIDFIMKQFTCLPASLQPKLMILQSATLAPNEFGFYSQAEQLLFQDGFFKNIKELLSSEANTNQLLSPEQCKESHYLARELPIILAVNSPSKHQNLQRLLQLLGLNVHVVSHSDAQSELWKTGLYCILITEFPEVSLLEMASKPLVNIAVFSLTNVMPSPEGNTYFNDWHIGQLNEQPVLDDLRASLAPWLQYANSYDSKLTSIDELIEDDEEIVITELLESLTEESEEAVFDFSKYLHHQGSVELALFMLGDYGQENQQQLDILIEAIKEKNVEKAKEAVLDLQLNAKILAASKLDNLCSQWLKLLSGNDIPNSLNEVNALIKETRAALNAIDSYADSI